jgi:hypothetical protein
MAATAMLAAGACRHSVSHLSRPSAVGRLHAELRATAAAIDPGHVHPVDDAASGASCDDALNRHYGTREEASIELELTGTRSGARVLERAAAFWRSRGFKMRTGLAKGNAAAHKDGFNLGVGLPLSSDPSQPARSVRVTGETPCLAA